MRMLAIPEYSDRKKVGLRILVLHCPGRERVVLVVVEQRTVVSAPAALCFNANVGDTGVLRSEESRLAHSCPALSRPRARRSCCCRTTNRGKRSRRALFQCECWRYRSTQIGRKSACAFLSCTVQAASASFLLL